MNPKLHLFSLRLGLFVCLFCFVGFGVWGNCCYRQMLFLPFWYWPWVEEQIGTLCRFPLLTPSAPIWLPPPSPPLASLTEQEHIRLAFAKVIRDHQWAKSNGHLSVLTWVEPLAWIDTIDYSPSLSAYFFLVSTSPFFLVFLLPRWQLHSLLPALYVEFLQARSWVPFHFLSTRFPSQPQPGLHPVYQQFSRLCLPSEHQVHTSKCLDVSKVPLTQLIHTEPLPPWPSINTTSSMIGTSTHDEPHSTQSGQQET